MKVLFIVNPVAGARRRKPAELRQQLQLPDCAQSEIAVTAGKSDARRIAAEGAQAGFELVVAVGGDGTVNEVGRGLLDSSGAQLGIVPIGSGNGVARHLSIPMEPHQAVKRLMAAKATPMDVGFINNEAFFCAAGVGFDARVSRNFARSKLRGLIGYTRIVLEAYGAYQPSAISMRLADETIDTSCYMLAFANASQYGNNIYIAPKADLSDGYLDVCLIDGLPFWRALRVGYSLAAGDLPKSGVAEFRTVTELSIQAEQPLEFHADGEFLGEAETFKVSLSSHAISIRA